MPASVVEAALAPSFRLTQLPEEVPLPGVVAMSDEEELWRLEHHLANRARAYRRARSRIRRYVIANQCTRLWSLTFAEAEHELPEVWRCWSACRKRLWSAGYRFAWVVVPELHPGGHGWHPHVLASEYVPKDVVAASWREGFVDLRRINAREWGTRDAAVAAALYGSKYLGKVLEAGGQGKSYDVARGYQPRCVEADELVAEQAVAALIAFGGESLQAVWNSASVEAFEGPGAVTFRFNRTR